jgi:hypothetical protein
MKTARLAAAVCTAALAALPALAEDLTIVYKATGPEGTGTATSYWSADRIRRSDPARDMIVEYGSGRMVTIDHHKKEYWETTSAEMEAAMKAAAAKMQQANAQLQERMASMPPALREKMQQMTGGAAGSVTVTKGGVRKVAGYDCQEYDVAMGTGLAIHMCMTTAIAPPAPNVDASKFASFIGPAGAIAANPMAKGVAQLAEQMRQIKGFPLVESSSFKVLGHATETTREATEVKRGPIPAADFDVTLLAKGCKKVESPFARMAK